MPPPIPEHQKRFTANPTRPARYRPGKAVPEEESSEEEEEDEEEVQQPRKPVRKPQARSTVPRIQAAPAEDEDEDDEEGFVTDDDDEDDAPGGAPVASNSAASNSASAAPTAKPISAAQRIPKPPVEDDEDEEDSGSEDEESDESDEESSSEDEAPQRKFQRPTFVKKTDRIQKAENRTEDIPEAKATPAPDIVSSHHDQDVAARRLAEAETMIKATIERDTAARLAGKKSWDDDDDLPPEALVDDTDGVDPEAEHSAWRLRELHRLKRDREVMVAREKELEEIERRRNLTAEERDAEDKEFLEKQKADREDGRGKAALLSKYHHKGAFFMDDEDSKRLAQRDLIGAKFADDVDKSTLPEYMRIRDMTKLGKKGRTRYTDLKGQDTGRFGDDVKRWKGSGYNNDNGPRDDLRGVDERFLPDSDRGGPTASGANASVVGIRRERRRSRSRSVNVSDRRRDQGGKDSYLPRSRSRSRSRDKRRRRYSSSRSRSPKRSRSRSLPRGSRRRRTPSPYHDRDKRRRIET